MAVTASDSNADQVASDSNADLPMDEYVEEDDFDTLPVLPDLVSDGDSGYGVDWNYTAGWRRLSDNKLVLVEPVKNSSGLYTFKSPGSDYRIYEFRLTIRKSGLPSSGTYGFTASVNQGNIDAAISGARVQYDIKADHVSPEYIPGEVNFENTGTSYTASANVTLPSNCSLFSVIWSLETPDSVFDLGDASYAFTFKGIPDAPSSSGGDVNNEQDIANGIGQQVEQGNTIIDLIKNTILTISSQLTAFWDQLAGEFTNLYNKMNTQHSEQMQSDQDTRDTIREEEEKSRNFIVDGIIEGLKSLFIPSDEYFKSWFDDMYSFFSDRLGFLMLPIDLLVQLVGIYIGADSSFSGIPFPEFKWLDGTVIIPAQTVGFTFLETEWGQEIQSKLYFVGNVIMIGALLNLMHRKLEEVLRN